MQQQRGKAGDRAGKPFLAANDSSVAASHSSGDHWNPFSPSSELSPASGAMPAGSSNPCGPVAMDAISGTESCLITAPAGSPDPFMPPPPLPAHERPQTQPQPVPKHDIAVGSAATRPLTATGSRDDALAGNRIQTPEQLRQRFAGGRRCTAVAAGCLMGPIWFLVIDVVQRCFLKGGELLPLSNSCCTLCV